ncbi:hypothetical protein COP1_003521 [Malus domestica]
MCRASRPWTLQPSEILCSSHNRHAQITSSNSLKLHPALFGKPFFQYADEEVAVSSLLGPFHSEEDSVEKYSEYPGEALMKLVLAKEMKEYAK